MDFGRLLAEPIMHASVVYFFFMSAFLSVFKTRRRYVKLSRAESTGIDQPALYTLTPHRPPWRPVLGTVKSTFLPFHFSRDTEF